MTDLEQLDAHTIETVLVEGNLARLSPEQRVAYYARVCETLGLNPLTRPFDYINFQGRLTLYANKDAASQLRHRDGISLEIAGREMLEAGIYLVIARATTRDGRTEESIGAVSIAGLKGQALADALMKAETKAKRRVTLAVCGLGWLDETEMDSVRVLDSDPSPPAVEQARPEEPAPRTPAGPPMSDRQRQKLRRRWVALDDAGQAQVRNRARAEGLPWPLGEAHAKDYSAYEQLLADAERAGWVAADLAEAWERGHQQQTERAERSRAVPSANAPARDQEGREGGGSVGEVGPAVTPPDDERPFE